MGDICYAPLIDDMTWSYSRVKSFETCPYKWYLRYIVGLHGKRMFFADYGTFMHKLLESFHKGEATPQQLVERYLCDFKKEVGGFAPSGRVLANYFQGGLQYLRTLQPVQTKVLGVEKEVCFSVGTYPFVGYIDLLCEQDGSLIVIDNKSRNLKPRSKRAKPTKTDAELDEYLRQLYIYSIAVENEYGRLPTKLCFNCFREQVFIQEPFSEKAFAASQEWLLSNIAKIRTESEFKPSVEFFKCTYLCEMQDHCEYFDLMRR